MTLGDSPNIGHHVNVIQLRWETMLKGHYSFQPIKKHTNHSNYTNGVSKS